MIEIRPLKELPVASLEEIGGGYISEGRYTVQKTESHAHTVITLDLTPFATPYVKRWEHSDEDEQRRYNEYLTQGYSLGAYDGDQLIGFALTEACQWNRTLWIWEFHVAASHRRQGIGRRLMDTLAENARQAGFRILGLETQNTNLPAITFYRSLGFELDGIDLSFYTNTDMTDGEVALFMKRKL